jgi:hypothetical protein
MNLFSNLVKYATKWQVTAERNFTQEEINEVDRAEVTSSDYGKSVCFHMVGGGMCFIALSNESTLNVGDTVDLKSASILTLSKDGEDDIQRIKA